MKYGPIFFSERFIVCKNDNFCTQILFASTSSFFVLFFNKIQIVLSFLIRHSLSLNPVDVIDYFLIICTLGSDLVVL